jgi:hypothetical protein
LLSIPAFGLCGYAALYCANEADVPEVASALLELEGVDFTLFATGPDAVEVLSPQGKASIEKRTDGARNYFRYEVSAGDPLKLKAISDTLRQENKLDERGFGLDDVWLERTAVHTYPDVLSNLFTSLHTHRVKHTADVLVSFRDGFYYGWSPFSRLVPLAATHGNALRPSSDAFLMSTHRALPPYVRADDAQPLLRD